MSSLRRPGREVRDARSALRSTASSISASSVPPGADSDLAVHNVFAGEGKAKVGIQSAWRQRSRVNLTDCCGGRPQRSTGPLSAGGRRSSQANSSTLGLYGPREAIFYGKIRVRRPRAGPQLPGVPHMLLWTRRRRSDSVLEILTNDVVRCGHVRDRRGARRRGPSTRCRALRSRQPAVWQAVSAA